MKILVAKESKYTRLCHKDKIRRVAKQARKDCTQNCFEIALVTQGRRVSCSTKQKTKSDVLLVWVILRTHCHVREPHFQVKTVSSSGFDD